MIKAGSGCPHQPVVVPKALCPLIPNFSSSLLWFLNFALLFLRKALKQRESKKQLHTGGCSHGCCGEPSIPWGISREAEDTQRVSALHMTLLPIIILITSWVTQVLPSKHPLIKYYAKCLVPVQSSKCKWILLKSTPANELHEYAVIPLRFLKRMVAIMSSYLKT